MAEFNVKNNFYCSEKSQVTWPKKCYHCLATRAAMRDKSKEIKKNLDKVKWLLEHGDELETAEYMFKVDYICGRVTQENCLEFESPFKEEEGNLVVIISSEE